MPAFAALSLSDGTAARTFDTSYRRDNLAGWRFVTGVFDANHTVTASVSLPGVNGKVSRVKHRVTVPIMDSVDVSVKLGEMVANVEFILPKMSSVAQRTVLLSYVNALLATSMAADNVIGLEGTF